MNPVIVSPGSKSARLLATALGLKRMLHRSSRPVTAPYVINYGLVGHKWESVKDSRSLHDKLIINDAPIQSKMAGVEMATGASIPAPEIRRCPQGDEHPEEWIHKPFYSKGGRNIFKLSDERAQNADFSRGYIQRYVPNRKYELRVTGALWAPMEKWGVWKKVQNEVPDDAVAWNHEQGGKFVRVHDPFEGRVFRDAMAYTHTLLKVFGLEFAAVDFIVSQHHEVMFLELNRQPGFTEEYGLEFYSQLFQALLDLPIDQVEQIINGELDLSEGTGEQASEPEEEDVEWPPAIDEQVKDELSAVLTAALEAIETHYGYTYNHPVEGIAQAIFDGLTPPEEG